MSISSVSIPEQRESSDTTSLVTGRLMRPRRTVPREFGDYVRALKWTQRFVAENRQVMLAADGSDAQADEHRDQRAAPLS